MFSRRGFIRIGASAAASLALRPFGLLPALAESGPDYRALVCIFLFGGNDSNNMVLPMDDASFQAYTTIRGSLALTSADLTKPAASASGSSIAFHSGLSEMASLFASKELAVIANVGSLVQPVTRAQYQQSAAPVPYNLFSHSDQQLQWQTSVAQGGSPTGWAGRVADYLLANNVNSGSIPAFFSVAGNALEGVGAKAQPVAIAPGQSLKLGGFNSSAESQARLNAVTNLLQLDSGISLAQAANGVVMSSMTAAKAIGSALSNATPLKTAFPATTIGAQLQQVAQVIQVQAQLGMQRQIFFCSLEGFDTHSEEIDTHNMVYPQLSPALAAFYNATQEMGVAENVTTFTESDFNRTLQPTSSDGSDHAWGGHHLVFGGAVKGGQVYGKFPSFELGGPDDADTRGRWIPTTAIDQYGATLCSWFGVPDATLSSIFPNLAKFATRDLGFLG